MESTNLHHFTWKVNLERGGDGGAGGVSGRWRCSWRVAARISHILSDIPVPVGLTPNTTQTYTPARKQILPRVDRFSMRDTQFLDAKNPQEFVIVQTGEVPQNSVYEMNALARFPAQRTQSFCSTD